MVRIVTVEDRCILNWERRKLMVRVKGIISMVIETDILSFSSYGISGVLKMGHKLPKRKCKMWLADRFTRSGISLGEVD